MATEGKRDALRGLVSAWTGKIEIAKRARKPWISDCDECMTFYTSSANLAMDTKRSVLWGGEVPSRNRMVVARAFEFVAIYGPKLYYAFPDRKVSPKRRAQTPWEILQQDPQLAMILPQLQQMEGLEMAKKGAIAALLEQTLQYTPKEQPGTGFLHSYQAVLDSLLTGRGVSWPRIFSMPESKRTLTGCFHDSSRNLLVDPDHNTVLQAEYIAREVNEPYWRTEEKFQLPPGTLKNKTSMQSHWGTSRKDRHEGSTNDNNTYYEVYSKMGVGSKLSGTEQDNPLVKALEEVGGRYVYLAIHPACTDYPLNLHPNALRGATVDKIKALLAWPTPSWRDDRWPCGILDYYHRPDSPYPIPPLQPGLGELKFLNKMWSFGCSHAEWTTESTIFVKKYAAEYVRDAYDKPGDRRIVELPEICEKIDDIVKIAEKPETNADFWKIMEAASQAFNMRVGLEPQRYGNDPGATSRSAVDADMKKQMLDVRPQHMMKQVEEWQSQLTYLEAQMQHEYCSGEDFQELLGMGGALAWDRIIKTIPPEVFARQFDYEIAAGSGRPPNKDRDAANMQQALQIFFPPAVEFAGATGGFGPMNAMIAAWGDANDQDVSQWLFQAPPPDPNKPDPAMVEAQAEKQKSEQELQIKREEGQMKLQQKGEEHAMKMQQKQQESQLNAQVKQNEAAHQMQMDDAIFEMKRNMYQMYGPMADQMAPGMGGGL